MACLSSLNNRNLKLSVVDTGALVEIISQNNNNFCFIFFEKTDCTHVHIHVCDYENLISSRLVVFRHYNIISHLLYLTQLL